LITIFSFTCLK